MTLIDRGGASVGAGGLKPPYPQELQWSKEEGGGREREKEEEEERESERRP